MCLTVSATYVVSRISKKDTRMWKKLLEDDVEIEKAKIYPDVLDFWKTIMVNVDLASSYYYKLFEFLLKD